MCRRIASAGKRGLAHSAVLTIGVNGDRGAVAAHARVAAAGFSTVVVVVKSLSGRVSRPRCGPNAAGQLGRVKSAAAGDGLATIRFVAGTTNPRPIPATAIADVPTTRSPKANPARPVAMSA